MAEYDGHTLYAGGEGCFSLQTTLTPDQLRQCLTCWEWTITSNAMSSRLLSKDVIGDFPVLLDYSYRPHDVSPCHVLKRIVLPGMGARTAWPQDIEEIH